MKKGKKKNKKRATNYTFLNASLAYMRKNATFSPLFLLTILSLRDIMQKKKTRELVNRLRGRWDLRPFT